MYKFWQILLLSTSCWVAVQAQSSPVGTWKTIDDKTGEAKSYVEVYEKGSKLYGKVTRLLLKPADTVCEKCKGDKANKPVQGMVIVDGLSKQGDTWKGGNIMDPENGNYYSCSLWLEPGQPNELRVRGKHWSGIYRTQTWYRVKE